MIFLIAVATLCGICAVLAALLVLADRYLNNYGVCRIRINDGERELAVDGGDSVLTSLMREGIFIPSACGGRGSCGLCKLRITDGAGPVLPTELPHLSASERRDGVRLSCQVKVRRDLAVEIPKELFSIRQFRARVARIDDLTHDIKAVRLELVEPARIEFVPGQYIQLEAPASSRSPEPVYRAYSVASDAGNYAHIDLIIRRVPNGICTTWVFEHLKVGDNALFNGPHGDFRIQDSDREMIFIAGGSGMAPFCSILADFANRGVRRKCRYFFGAVAARDMFYVERMREFEKTLADFAFIPALSNPTPDDHWDGATGLITDVVGRHYEDCSNMEAYLCGSPGMIDACIRVLKQRGLPEDRVFFDKFA